MYSPSQLVLIAVMSLVLYGSFVLVQTTRHRDYFLPHGDAERDLEAHAQPPGTLAAALSALRRRARRLVWVNPLLGQPDYRPTSRAMQAALPHLDLFAAGADLASVERMLLNLIETLR